MDFLIDPINFLANWLQGLLLGWGASPDLVTFLLKLVGAGGLAIGAMLWCIFLIWVERKLIGRVQDRPGPNRVGPFGLFQPIADMLKIFTKEYITPAGADKVPYNLAPIMAVASVLLMWAVIPLAVTTYGAGLNAGVLYIVAVGAIGELGIIMAGWSSNNKYALLGAFRVVAQLVSYEVPMVLSLLVPVLLARSMNLNDLVKAQNPWFLLIVPVAAVVFLITQQAEVGRAPFDLLEAESEIVAGFNIEYSGLKFGMFFVAEFLHGYTVALLFATLFLGGWRGPGAEQYPILGFLYLSIKTAIVYFFQILVRSSLPRLRIDQMLAFNWKILTPVSLGLIGAVALVAKALQNSSSLTYNFGLIAANVVVLLVLLVSVRWFAVRSRRLLTGGLAQETAEAEQIHV